MKRGTRRPILLTGVQLIHFLVLNVTAPAQELKPQGIEFHPTPENIPEVIDPQFILRAEPKFKFMYEADYEKITIGVEEGDYHEMFGAIDDVAVVGNGTLLVLDREYSEVRVIGFDGSFIGTFGKPGEGPGEFRYPPNHVLVLDEGKRAMTVGFGSRFIQAFERKDDATFRPIFRFPSDVRGGNGCAMNGYFYHLGDTAEMEGVLHKLTYDGERVASFLEFYKSPRQDIASIMSGRGHIACSEKHGIIALNRTNAPVVSGYTEQGALVWRVKFADFEPVKYREEYYSNGQASWRSATPQPGQSLINEIFTDPSGDFYVHYSTAVGTGWDGIPDEGPLFKIDARTGAGAYLGEAPRIRDVASGILFTASNDPYPHLVIYKRKAGVN